MSGILESRDHWLALANEQDRRADWDSDARPAAKHRAETYRRAARSMELEMQTGVWHCVCCLKPMHSLSR